MPTDAAPPGQPSAVYRCPLASLVALLTWRDLLFCAKHLLVAARTQAVVRRLTSPLGRCFTTAWRRRRFDHAWSFFCACSDHACHAASRAFWRALFDEIHSAAAFPAIAGSTSANKQISVSCFFSAEVSRSMRHITPPCLSLRSSPSRQCAESHPDAS